MEWRRLELIYGTTLVFLLELGLTGFQNFISKSLMCLALNLLLLILYGRLLV